jgi:CHAT domain-containing protein
MKSAPLIHFATHGLAYGTSSAARRSFVAFAPDSTNDGLLTLGELMDDKQLTLTAELVVLSACQTGLGDMKKAEGSIGLQRAFLAKGARSVLVSLWNVDDKATRLLMEKFYAYWLDPTTVRTKARALQMAQDAVRRTPGYANPKYWAAFQLVGAE